MNSLPSGLAVHTDEVALRPLVRLNDSQPSSDSILVQPSDSSQIQALIKWANEQRKSLLPVSSPSTSKQQSDSSVIVDLSTMRRIRHIDGVDAIAVIEPGVTFPEFDAQLANHGLRAFKPLLPPRGKSALACYLERTPTISPREQWDSCDPLSTVEMVFGNGKLFRTGTAGVEDDLEQQLEYGLRQMGASGPFTTDFMRVVMGSQGTLSIVSWGAVYCERIPALEKAFFVPSAQLAPLLALSSKIAWRKLAAHSFIANSTQLALILGTDRESVVQLCKQLPKWTLFVNIAAPDYLPEQRMEYEKEALLQDADELSLEVVEWLQGQLADRVIKMQQNLPDAYYKERLEAKFDEVFFLSQVDKVEPFIETFEQLSARHNKTTQAIYLQPMVQGSCCHVEFTTFWEAQAADSSRIQEAFHAELSHAIANKGAYFSRPYGIWRDIAYQKDPHIIPHLKKVKSIFDPNNVLKPNTLI